MKYSPVDLGNYNSQAGSNTAANPILYARVERVITTPSDNGYKENGGLKALNGIFFTFLQSTKGKSDEAISESDFAYPSSINLFHVPIPGEVVQIISVPNPDTSTMTLSGKYYYTSVVNFWNHPKDGLFFDLYRPLVLDTNHRKFKLNPLLISEGDTVIQGRYGQYIRFSKEGKEVNPYMVFSTGRPYKSPENSPVAADINKDYSTVEFHTKGIAALKSVNTFIKTHRKDFVPKSTDTYEGEQILVNTGRIVLNAKEDSVLVASKKAIATSSETLNQEATKEICMDAPKIYIGAGSMNSSLPEPLVLGHKVEQFLSDVIDQLIEVADSLKIATTVSGEQLPIVNQKGAKVSVILRSLKSKLNPQGSSELKSKKSFVE